MLTALVADDEEFARTHLCRVLEELGTAVQGEAADAAEAIQKTEDLKPDVLFLDVQMPGLSGLQVAGALVQLERPPVIVFVSAFTEYAVPAFEQNALDYLVKPVSPARVARTLARARSRMADVEARARLRERLTSAMMSAPPMRRLPIRVDYAVRLIPMADIRLAVSRERRVFVCTSESEFRTYYSLSQLEEILPQDQFVRIHDSCIVRLDLIEEINFLGNHSYCVTLSGGQQAPVGKTRYSELQQKLGISAAK